MSETNNQSQLTVSQEQLDVLDQLLKPEVQDSLNNLVEQLPKLTEMVTLLTKSYDFASTLATDETLKKDTVAAVTEMATPVISGAKAIARNAVEAKDRAEVSNETIGVFGLMKMLKDPQVQGILRFANAFLEVSAEQKAKK
jgi:uncharacterized protein YjgD (DUF1641 family)